MQDLPPIILGAAGLTGRPQIGRPFEHEGDVDEYGYLVEPEPRRSKTIPPNCLRVLNSPLAAGNGGGCQIDCPGKQRDGGCLCDIVRAANKAGVEWQFDVSADGRGGVWWDYTGPPLDDDGGVHGVPV